MLSVSAKCTYSIHALYELALSYGKSSMNIKEIANAQEIPEDYLRQLLVVLKKAGLVESTRGVDGGYSLAKPPAVITIREIIESLEGPIKLINTLSDDPILANFWTESDNAVRDIFNVTLGDLVVEKQKIDRTITYYI